MTDELQNAEATKLKDFLETYPPNKNARVRDLWSLRAVSSRIPHDKRVFINNPPLTLFCDGDCDGERNHKCSSPPVLEGTNRAYFKFLNYFCANCGTALKTFAVALEIDPTTNSEGTITKLGELPPFGVKMPNRVLRLFGTEDGQLFLKGRQCENQGYGIAAFSYYRRVVENHKNDLFDQIISVGKLENFSEELLEELRLAKDEVQFTSSISKIKAALPSSLMIAGGNPLTALHSALSIGIHSETDDACLESASAVRLVLTQLVEKIARIKKEHTEFSQAIRLLQDKRKGKSTSA